MKKKHPYQREELDKWADSLYTTKKKLEFINRIKK